ncbi:MAG: hypothetical protein WEC39_02485 [Patescibacteria group bacterium]
MNFLKFYVRGYLGTQYEEFGGANSFWFGLLQVFGIGTVVFLVLEYFARGTGWVWFGRVWFVYLSVYAPYFFLIKEPLRMWKEPIEAKRLDALKRQRAAVVRAIKGFYHETIVSKGKNPTHAASRLMDAVIVFHHLCRAANSADFSGVQEDMDKLAVEMVVHPLELDVLGRTNSPVPNKFKISTFLPGGKKFKFEEPVS